MTRAKPGNERPDRAELLKLDKESLVERILMEHQRTLMEHQRASKALTAKDERVLEVHHLKREIKELEAWKQRAEKLLSEVRTSADKLLSRNFNRLLRGPKVRKKSPDEGSPIPAPAPDRPDVRMSNFLPDAKPRGGILLNPGPFR
jgi:seryl-tRNA synthetase